jgi:hypothetical protein
LELFSLEREGRPVAGWPFHLFFVAMLRFAIHRPSFLYPNSTFASVARRVGGLAAQLFGKAARSTPLDRVVSIERILAPDAIRSGKRFSVSHHSRVFQEDCPLALGQGQSALK